MYCKCGCGEITTKMKRTKGKYKKGEYRDFINGHNIRTYDNEEQSRRANHNDGSKLRGRITGSGNAYIKYRQIHLHRIVAEEKLGRPLLKGEIVHHIDGNKKNNSIDNIHVFSSQSEHAKHHFSEYWKNKKEIRGIES